MPHTAVTLDPLRHLVIISADQALTHKLVATVQEVARGATVHVTTVADFDPALDLIERERPQAAVIDLRLPGSNVPALIAHLSRNGRRPLPAPMVAICEAGAESAAALKAGIHDCIERTATAHDLEQALHRARLAWHTQKLLAEQEQDTVDAHQRAKRAEAEFELLADTAPAMLWQADRRGHRHWFSRAWYAFTGLASQSPTDAQAAWLDAVFPSDQELCRSLSTLLERGTGRFRVEYRLRDQTGRFRWVEDACEPSDAGGFVGCCIDIDERKRTEAMLAEREQVLSAMVAKAAVGLAEITAHDRRIRTANPHLIRMLRTSADDLLGSELQEWVHPGATQRIDQAFAALAQHGKALRLPDLRCWSARGRSVWVDLTLSPVHHEEDGRLHGAVAALQSITVHREQRRALEQRNQELSELAAVSSHDLQAPLRSIGVHLDLLRSELGTLTPSQHELFDHAQHGVGAMRRLIEGILGYMHTEEHLRKLDAIDLNECFEQARSNLSADLGTSQAQVICDKLPTVMGNGLLLTQCLQNLVGNALKHVPRPKGVITISAEHDHQHDEWVIAVSDNGPGVPDEQHDDLFRLFSTTDSNGHGIGLAFCRRVIEACGGEIWYDPQPQGARFCFSLPAHMPDNDSGPQLLRDTSAPTG